MRVEGILSIAQLRESPSAKHMIAYYANSVIHTENCLESVYTHRSDKSARPAPPKTEDFEKSNIATSTVNKKHKHA